MNNPNVSRAIIAAIFIISGVSHFAATKNFAEIVPPFLPSPYALVYISGAAELVGAIGILIAPVRMIAALGLIALLIAVLPANVYMAVAPAHFNPNGSWLIAAILWLRLPLQALLIAWVWKLR